MSDHSEDNSHNYYLCFSLSKPEDFHHTLLLGSSSNLVVISFLFQLSSSFLILLKVVDMFAF